MIWDEEKYDRDESRHRMKTIAYASEFYKEITNDYNKVKNYLNTFCLNNQ